MKRRHLVLTIALLALLPGAALAQAYPSKTVKIIAPVQPGGGVDLVGRTIAGVLAKSLGHSFVVENVSGGGGVIASQNVARAAPDGYTLMILRPRLEPREETFRLPRSGQDNGSTRTPG